MITEVSGVLMIPANATPIPTSAYAPGPAVDAGNPDLRNKTFLLIALEPDLGATVIPLLARDVVRQRHALVDPPVLSENQNILSDGRKAIRSGGIAVVPHPKTERDVDRDGSALCERGQGEYPNKQDSSNFQQNLFRHKNLPYRPYGLELFGCGHRFQPWLTRKLAKGRQHNNGAGLNHSG